MLKNDPPTGTRVRFLRNINNAKKGYLATLVLPIRKFEVENAGDQYEVEFNGKLFGVSES